MLLATTVTTVEELLQIHLLNKANLKQYLSEDEKEEQGFVSWLYSLELLEKMHDLLPSVIIKNDDRAVGYALATSKDARSFHPDLDVMFSNIEKIELHGKPLLQYNFYCMGQICIDKPYRGKGLVKMLYQKHFEVYSSRYDMLLTEISTSNFRSLKAHQNIGFQTIHTYKDHMDEWSVVIWDWHKMLTVSNS